MLENIRSHSQSWLIKGIFALIVLVFVFWGVGSYNTSRSSVLATINGEPISLQDFRETYERGVQYIRQRQPQLGQDDFRNLQLKQQIFNQMVNREVLLQAARRLGFNISAHELRTAIEGIGDFANEEGKFDPEVYKKLLKANQLTPASFELEMRQGMLIEKMQKAWDLSASVSEEEVRDIFDFARSSVDMSYVEFLDADYEKQVVLAENEAKAVYESRKEKYVKPEQSSFSLLELTAENLAPTLTTTDDEIKSYYQENLDQFKEEEKVHARHILLQTTEEITEEEEAKLLEKATRIQKEWNGENFAELAKKYSEGPTASRGGDLGWFGHGQMVAPFEEAAFALKKGEISQPVRTIFGYHLIYVEDRADARTLALDEVQDQISKNLRYEKASANLLGKLDEVVELLLTGSTLEDAVEKLGLEITRTPLLPKGQAPAGLQLDEKALVTLNELQVNATLTEPLILQDGYLFARKEEFVPATPIPFAEVKDDIEAELRMAGARQLALEAAKQAVEAIKNGQVINAADVKSKTKISRQGFIPELGMNQKMTNELFTAEIGQWLPEVYEIGSGVVVVRLDQRNLPELKVWEEEKEMWKQSLSQNKKQELFQATLLRLRDEAEVKILNEHILVD